MGNRKDPIPAGTKHERQRMNRLRGRCFSIGWSPLPSNCNCACPPEANISLHLNVQLEHHHTTYTLLTPHSYPILVCSLLTASLTQQGLALLSSLLAVLHSPCAFPSVAWSNQPIGHFLFEEFLASRACVDTIASGLGTVLP